MTGTKSQKASIFSLRNLNMARLTRESPVCHIDPVAALHERIFGASHLLRSVRFIFDYVWMDVSTFLRQRSGWLRLVAYIPLLPDTVDTIHIEFSELPAGKRADLLGSAAMGRHVGSVFTDGLSRVENLLKDFEEAVARRQQPFRVLMVSSGKPVFSLQEQAQLRAFFPNLSASGSLDF